MTIMVICVDTVQAKTAASLFADNIGTTVELGLLDHTHV